MRLGWGVNCNICNDFIYGHSYGPTCPDCMKNKSKDAMTTCKCSEIPWHPYPEEKPEEMGKFYECTLKDVNKTYDMLWQDFKWMNDDGQHIPSVIAFTEKRPPYTPPPKKKTVRVSRSVLSQALKKLIFVDSGELLMPDFIEIEVEE